MLIVESVDQNERPDDVLDPAYAQFRDQTRFWIQRVAVPLIMVIGLFGNLVTVIIMTRRRMRSTTNMYLAALAFVDMLYLVLTFMLGLSHYPNMAERRYYLYWHLRPFLMMFTDACSNTSVWLTVTFTIERFIAVKYPMKGKVWCTEARAKKLIICVFMFGLLFASPVPFEWKVIEKQMAATPTAITNITGANKNDAFSHNYNVVVNNNDNVVDKNLIDTSPVDDETKLLESTMAPTSINTNNDLMVPIDDQEKHNNINNDDALDDIDPSNGAIVEPNPSNTIMKDSFILALDYSQFGRNETYKTIYYWSTAVIFYFIPLISLTLFNGFLIKSVHHSQRERDKMTNRQSFARKTIRSDEKIITTNTGGSQEIKFQLDQGYNNGHQLMANSTSTTQRPCQLGGLKLILVPPSSDFEAKTSRQVSRFSTKSTILSTSHDRCFSSDSGNEGATLTATSVIEGHTKGVGPQNDTKLIEFNNAQVSIDCTNELNSKTNQSSRLKHINDLKNVQTNCDLSPYGRVRLNLPKEYNRKQNDTAIMRTGDYLTRFRLATHDRLQPSPSRLLDSISGDSSIIGTSVNEETASEIGSCGDINKTEPHQEVAKSTVHSGTIRSSSSSTNLNPNNTINSHATPPASSQERRITIMLIAVVILFLVCQIPSAAMLLYTSVHETVPNTNEHALLLAFGNIFNFLMAINAAGNFILYSFLSKKYRRTFVIIFCGCLGGASKTDTRRVGSQQTKQCNRKTKQHTQQTFRSSSPVTGNHHSYSSAPRIASGVRFGNIDHRMAPKSECLLASNDERQPPDTLV